MSTLQQRTIHTRFSKECGPCREDPPRTETQLRIALLSVVLAMYVFSMRAQQEAAVDMYGYAESAKASDIKASITFDKFRDLTFVQLSHPLELHIAPGDLNVLMMQPSYSCSGNTSNCRPDDVTLEFTAVGEHWDFLKSDRQLTLLLDSKRLVVGKLNWSGEPRDSGLPDIGVQTWEQMSVTVPTATFEAILHAKTVEGELGFRSFSLGDEQLAALKRLFSFPVATKIDKESQ